MQFKDNIGQIEESVSLTRRWVHRAFHAAEDSGQAKTAKLLKSSQALLDDVRALLDEAAECCEKESAASSAASVNLV